MSSDKNEDSKSTRWAVRVRALQQWTSAESLSESPTRSLSPDHSGVPLKNLATTSHRTGETSGELASASSQNPEPPGSIHRKELSAVIMEDSSEDNDNGTMQASGVSSDPVVPFGTDIEVSSLTLTPSDMQLDVEDDSGSDELNIDAASQEKYQCSLLYYLCIMYYMCVWPHDVKKQNRHWILKRIHQVFYLMCSTLSLIMNVRITKYHIMTFLAGTGKLDEFVSVALSLVQTIAKVYFIWLYTMQYNKVSIIDRFTEMVYACHALKKINKENVIIGILLGIAAIILSLIFCLFWSIPFNSWSMEEVVGLNAYILGDFGLSWGPRNYNNASNMLFERFSENATSTTKYSLGTFGMVINFLGRLQDSVMCDVVLIMAISLYQTMMNFIKNLETYGHEVTKREKLWSQYEYMKSIASQINELFGNFIILIHMYNALAIALFLMKGLSQEMSAATLLFGATAAKVTLIYCIGSKISYQNKKIKQWVRDLCVAGSQVRIGGREWNIYVLVDEVTDNQIGFGKDEFFIDQKFVLTFFTGVTTLFVMLAEFHEKQKNN